MRRKREVTSDAPSAWREKDATSERCNTSPHLWTGPCLILPLSQGAPCAIDCLSFPAINPCEGPLVSDEVDQAFNYTDMPRRRSGSGSSPKEAADKQKSRSQPGKSQEGGQTCVELPESQKAEAKDEIKNNVSKVEAKKMLSEILRKKCTGSDLSRGTCNTSKSTMEHVDMTSAEAHSVSASDLIGAHSDVQSPVEAHKADPVQTKESNMNIVNEEQVDRLFLTRGRRWNEQYRTVLSISTKNPRVGMREDLKMSEDGTTNVFVSNSTLRLERNLKVADKDIVKHGEIGAGRRKAAEPQFTELDGLPPSSEITKYNKTLSPSEPRSITYSTYQSPRKKSRRRKSLEKKKIALPLESDGKHSEVKQVTSPNVGQSQNDSTKLRFPSPESPMLSPKSPAKEVVIEQTEFITIEENIVTKGSRNELKEKQARSVASSQISEMKVTETKSISHESKIDNTMKNYSDQKTPDERIQESDGIRGVKVDACAKTPAEQSPSSTNRLQTKGLSQKLSDLSSRYSQWTVDSENSNVSNRVKLKKTADVPWGHLERQDLNQDKNSLQIQLTSADVAERNQQITLVGPTKTIATIASALQHEQSRDCGATNNGPGSQEVFGLEASGMDPEQLPVSEKRQLGPEQGKPGPEQGKPGPEQGKPGPEQGKPGPEQGKPGPEQGKPGPEQGKPGPEQGKPGPEQGKPGPEQGKPGPEQGKPGPEQGKPGPEQGKLHPEQQPSLRERNPVLEGRQPGPEEWQPGLEEQLPSQEKRKAGPEQQKPTTEQWEPGPEGKCSLQERQPGPEQQKPCAEQPKPGPVQQSGLEEQLPVSEKRQTGQEQWKPVPEERQLGPEQRKPVPEERQLSPEEHKSVPVQEKPCAEQRQPGPEWEPSLQEQLPMSGKQQPGTEQWKPVPEEQQPGPEERQPGPEERQPGPEERQPGPEERQPGPEERQPGPEERQPGPEERQPDPEKRQPVPVQQKQCVEQQKPGPEWNPGLQDQRQAGPEQRESVPVQKKPCTEQRKPGSEQQKPGPEQGKPGQEQRQPGPEQGKPGPEQQEPGLEQWKPGSELQASPQEQQTSPEERQHDLAERQPCRPKLFYNTTDFKHDTRSLHQLEDAQNNAKKMHHDMEGSFIATDLSHSADRRETNKDNDVGIALTVEHPKSTEPVDSDIGNSIPESQINVSPIKNDFTETAKQSLSPDGNGKGEMTKVLKVAVKGDFKDSSGVKAIDLRQQSVDITTQNITVMEPKNQPQMNGDVAVKATQEMNDSPVASEKSILPCSGPKQSQVALTEESHTHSPENLTVGLLEENRDLDESKLPKKILAEHNDLPYFSMEPKDIPKEENDLQLPSSKLKAEEPLHSNLHYNVTQQKRSNDTSTDVTGQSIHTFTTEAMTDEEGHRSSSKMRKEEMAVNAKTFLSVENGVHLVASNNRQSNASTEVSSEKLQHNGSNFSLDSMEVLNTVTHPHPAVAIKEDQSVVCEGVEIVQMENDDSTLAIYPEEFDDIYSMSLDKLPTIREDIYFEEIEEGEEVCEKEEEDEEGIAPGTKKQKYFPDTDVYEMFKEIKIPDYSEYFTQDKKDLSKTYKQRMQLGKMRPALELQKSRPASQFRRRNLTPSGVSGILNSVKYSSESQQQLNEEDASASAEEKLDNPEVAVKGSRLSQIGMYAKTKPYGIDSMHKAKIEVKPGGVENQSVQNKRLANASMHSEDSRELPKQPLDIPEEENSEHQAHLQLTKEAFISDPDQSQEYFDDEEREGVGSSNEPQTVSEMTNPLVPGARNYMLMTGSQEMRDADGKMPSPQSRGLGVKPTEEVQAEGDKKQPDDKVSPVRKDLQIQEKRVNPRPGKVVIFSEPDFAGKQIQVFSSVPDATSWNLSNTISLQVIRGGWLVFKEPNYEGETFSLEEGECEGFCPWQKTENQEDDHDEDGKHPIGSMKLIVNDNSLPEITLYAQANCCGNPMVYHEEVECLELYNIKPMVTSITVQSGVWVLHHAYGYNDVIGVLEPGVYPTLESWGAVESVLGSFYPLCMGNLKVENPNEPKIVLYEEEEFCGRSQEMCVAIPELTDLLQEAHPDVPHSVGSLRVLAGLWVAYEEPGFQGRQMLFEEGEFPRPSAWGGHAGRLRSLRPICCDFGSPQLLLLEDPEIEHGKELQLMAEHVADLQLFGFGTHISELEVQQGVWVAYEEANYCGEQYILERGLYRSHLDWGGSEPSIGSVRPVFLHRTSEPTSESRVVLYGQKNFLGARLEVTESLKVLPDAWLGGGIASIRVLAGCWVLYSAAEFSGLEFVLEEGSYPCREDFACPEDSQLASLHALPHDISEPFLSLFSRPGLSGRELELVSPCRSLTDLGHDGRVSSVRVHSGIWAVFEFPNFRGHQMVLESCEVPNWKERTGWSVVGSLYPLKRCQLYIRLRNSGRNGALAVAKDPLNNEDLCVCLLPDEAGLAQNWLYRDGILRNLECELCLEVVQEAAMMSNSQLQLAGENGHTTQKWTIQPDGFISSVSDPDLILDVKDSFYYDHNVPVVLNQRTAFRTTQKWGLEFL
uniref:beta/gamma crystallin domain-containing protein 1-like isoform X2 n=1 Tax=Myxine glutinosa TaxID=7769 RepID=UPI00358E8ED1